MRDIKAILRFRTDISPFLAHLTRDLDGLAARDRLREILRQMQLTPGSGLVSDVRFGGNLRGIDLALRRRLFAATCFTETPIAEVHCLLEIDGRAVNLAPFGLVFIKERLRSRGVCPVVYLNNEAGEADATVQALFSLKDTHAAAAEKLLPLVAIFGEKIRPPDVADRPEGRVDFVWEREWRYPAASGDFAFTFDDVFCGLCPHGDIDAFEEAYPPLRFIDPQRNMKWYAEALIACRQRLGLQHSVV